MTSSSSASGPTPRRRRDRYWSLSVNGRFAGGGCLTKVVDGDAVHFSYGSLFDRARPGPAGRRRRLPRLAGAGDSPVPGSTQSPRSRRGLAARAAAISPPAPAGDRDAVGATGAGTVRRGRGPAQASAELIEGRLGELRGGSVEHDVNATALAVLALERLAVPAAAARAARWLLSVQDPGGGFGFRPGVSADVDTTGLVSLGAGPAGTLAAGAPRRRLRARGAKRRRRLSGSPRRHLQRPEHRPGADRPATRGARTSSPRLLRALARSTTSPPWPGPAARSPTTLAPRRPRSGRRRRRCSASPPGTSCWPGSRQRAPGRQKRPGAAPRRVPPGPSRQLDRRFAQAHSGRPKRSPRNGAGSVWSIRWDDRNELRWRPDLD